MNRRGFLKALIIGVAVALPKIALPVLVKDDPIFVRGPVVNNYLTDPNTWLIKTKGNDFKYFYKDNGIPSFSEEHTRLIRASMIPLELS